MWRKRKELNAKSNNKRLSIMSSEIYLLLASQLTPFRQNQFILVITKLVLKVILGHSSSRLLSISSVFCVRHWRHWTEGKCCHIYFYPFYLFFFQPVVICFVQNIPLSEGYANNLEKKSKQGRGKKKRKKVTERSTLQLNNFADV